VDIKDDPGIRPEPEDKGKPLKQYWGNGGSKETNGKISGETKISPKTKTKIKQREGAIPINSELYGKTSKPVGGGLRREIRKKL